MTYLAFLAQLHAILQPRCYLEIGVRWGDSLALSRCRSLGIDPAFKIDNELHTEVQLFKTTSDEYFSRPAPLAPVGGAPFDLSFIDGMHLFEFALRDFINAERHSRARSVIVFDDIFPRTVEEASRVPGPRAWTGDIYPLLEVFARYRPDLVVVPVDTQPTGLLLLMALDPSSTVVADHYDEIVAEFRHPDPQPVPAAVFGRVGVQPPDRVLTCGLLQTLASAPDDLDPARIAADLRTVAADELGPVFARS
jgi:hypothetical protein